MPNWSKFPELEICSDCKENTAFVYDTFEDNWVSVCCWARAVSVEVHPALERD